jgi:FlaA1/EpsC-like NDP-sugar epimerase
LRGQYIGGVPILGTIQQVASIVNEVNADQVVIACSVSPEWLKVVRQLLEPTGVRVTVFSFSELPLD